MVHHFVHLQILQVVAIHRKVQGVGVKLPIVNENAKIVMIALIALIALLCIAKQKQKQYIPDKQCSAHICLSVHCEARSVVYVVDTDDGLV